MKPAEAAPCPNQFKPAVGRSRANPFELPLALKWGSELQRVLEVCRLGAGPQQGLGMGVRMRKCGMAIAGWGGWGVCGSLPGGESPGNPKLCPRSRPSTLLHLLALPRGHNGCQPAFQGSLGLDLNTQV